MATTVNIGKNTTGSPSMDYGANSIDSFMEEANPTDQNGSATTLAFRQSTNADQTPLFSFPDITNITGPVTVTASSLNVWQTGQFINETDVSVVCRKLVRDWIESEVTYAIWKAANNWSSGGAETSSDDRNDAISGSGTWDATDGEYKVLTGSQMDTDNEGDINGTTDHYGFVLAVGAANGALKNHTSGEGTDGNRPYLSITFETASGDDLTASDGYEFSDSANLTASVQMTIADGYEFSDSLSNSASILMSMADVYEFSDENQNIGVLLMSMADSYIFSDEISLQSGNFMNLSDRVEFSGSQNLNASVILTLNDGYTLSDAYSAISSAVMGMEDTYIVSDSISLSTGVLVEGPIKITVQTKQAVFDIIVKKPDFGTTTKEPKFNIEIN